MKKIIILTGFLLVAMPVMGETGAQNPDIQYQNPDIQYQDPNADRIGFNSTAEVLPKGAMSFNDYDVGILQFSWGVAKDLELSFTTTVPVFQATFVPSLKWQVVNTDRVRFALQAYAGVYRTFVPYNSNDVTIAGGGLAGIVDICVGRDCSSIISLGGRFAGGAIIRDDSSKHTLLSYQLNSDGVFRVSKRVKLFLGMSFEEMYSRNESYKHPNFSGIGSFGIQYGVRIYGKRFAADLGMVRPVFYVDNGTVHGVEDVMKYMPIGYPFLSFTYKW